MGMAGVQTVGSRASINSAGTQQVCEQASTDHHVVEL